ncbi:MAG: hypothetical protein U0350_29930 [Caldilineaceae bacterium]
MRFALRRPNRVVTVGNGRCNAKPPSGGGAKLCACCAAWRYPRSDAAVLPILWAGRLFEGAQALIEFGLAVGEDEQPVATGWPMAWSAVKSPLLQRWSRSGRE